MKKIEITPARQKQIDAFAAEQQRLINAPLPKHEIRNGRVFYESSRGLPRLVTARVKDGKDREWTAKGPSCAEAYWPLLERLEKMAKHDPTVKVLLGVIEGPPERKRRNRGPAQGSLL